MGNVLAGSSCAAAWLMVTLGDSPSSTVTVLPAVAAGAWLPAWSEAVPAAMLRPSSPEPAMPERVTVRSCRPVPVTVTCAAGPPVTVMSLEPRATRFAPL